MSKDYILKKLNKFARLEKAKLPENHGYSFEIQDNLFFNSGDIKIPYKRLMAYTEIDGAKVPVGSVQFGTDDGRHSAYDVEVDENHRRKGLASAMYAHIEKTLGGTMVPSSVMTNDGEKFWEGNKKDPQFGELKKGVAQRLFPFNPRVEVDENERDSIEGWVNDVDAGSKQNIPRLEGNARARAMQKLHNKTQFRRNPKTGEREFLLHRGKTASDCYDGTLGNSFTPDFDVAQGFAEEAQGELHPMYNLDFGVVSAWIPESKIHHIPKQVVLGSDSLDDEHEVIVDEDYVWGGGFDESIHEFTPLGKKPKQSIDTNSKINQRGKLEKNKSFYKIKDELSKADVDEEYYPNLNVKKIDRDYDIHHKSYRLKNGMFHHIFAEPDFDDSYTHVLSSSQDPFDAESFLSKLIGNVGYDGDLYVDSSQAHEIGKGHGKMLYERVLGYHGSMISDTKLSPGSHKIYSEHFSGIPGVGTEITDDPHAPHTAKIYDKDQYNQYIGAAEELEKNSKTKLRLTKSRLDLLAKGRKALPVGTVRERGGVKYVKTSTGWERQGHPGNSNTESSATTHQQNPREEADKENQNNKQYVNARESKFSNIGEDVAGSARHKAAEWAGIRAAIDSGLGDKLITRDKLLKVEPLALDIDKNSNRAFDDAVITMAMKKFPPKPNSQFLKAANGLEDEEVAVVLRNGKLYTTRLYSRQFPDTAPDKSWTAGEIREGALNDYYSAFVKMKDAFKKLSDERKAKISPDAEIDPMNLLQDIRETARSVLNDLKSENTFGQAVDIMVDYINKTLNIRSNSSTSLVAAARDAALHIKSSEDPVEAMYNLAISLNDGKGISDATGNKRVGPKKFKMSDMYEGAAKRIGPESPTKDFNSQVDYLTKNTGMRGIQWGNSVTDSEREYHLAQTTTAFQDLTDILGLPAEMGSFNGRLALAIGARGKGKAMAHYEPNTNTINLTRAKGVGSLAHEWGHFIDKIVGETHGSQRSFLSELSVYDRSSDQPVMAAMSGIVNSQAWKNLRSMTIDNMREMNKNGFSFTNRDAQYWTSTTEMFARVFETYVDYKLKQAGRENTYLVAGNRGLFWPTDEMMTDFAPLLDNFIETFKNSEHLKKSLLRKDAGQIKFQNLNHKWTRPDQQVKTVPKNDPYQDRKAELYNMGKEIYGSTPSERVNSPQAYGEYVPDRSGNNKPDYAIVGENFNQSSKIHEGFHYLTQRLVDNHGIEKVNSLYDRLISNIHPKINEMIESSLLSNPSYRQMHYSKDPRFQLHFKEEKINLLHDFNHGDRRKQLQEFVKRNPRIIEHTMGFKDGNHFDATIKQSWKKVRDTANSIKKEDL